MEEHKMGDRCYFSFNNSGIIINFNSKVVKVAAEPNSKGWRNKLIICPEEAFHILLRRAEMYNDYMDLEDIKEELGYICVYPSNIASDFPHLDQSLNYVIVKNENLLSNPFSIIITDIKQEIGL